MARSKQTTGFYSRYCLGRYCIVISGLFLLPAQGTVCVSSHTDDSDFVCGGKVESEVWQLWDNSAKEYLRTQQFFERLEEQGDTYALYDVQTYTHNLVAMARRCQRVERLEDLAEVLDTAYSALGAYPEGKTGLAWVCKGGAVCNSKNQLINREVMLNSAQFLALTASVANGLVQAPKQHRQGKFVEQTAIVGLQHLLRWGDADAVRRLDKQLAAQAQDVKDGSSTLFFTDKPLWMIAIYADLAGVLQKQPSLHSKVGLSDGQLLAMSGHLSLLLRLFAARTAVEPAVGRNGQTVKVADLDRGFWRLYANNKYAGYTGSEKPVTCIQQLDGTFQKKVSLDAALLVPVSNLGWDISHSRRLVHAFDAIERNRRAMQEVFGVEETALPSAETMHAFAQQLAVRVWNGDVDFPLFSNYWSGTNGWYRVAYDNGTSRCMEGYPPFGITDSFATGGYASWSSYVPEVRILGRRLYQLSGSNDASHRQFIDKYYPGFGVKASAANGMLMELMFWPSLVEAPQ